LGVYGAANYLTRYIGGVAHFFVTPNSNLYYFFNSLSFLLILI
jgi:hypothetical protein